MPARKLQKFDKNKAFFHIYNKGVEKRNLFKDQEDYDIFQGFLNDYLTAPPDPEKTKKSFSVNGRTFRGVPHQPKNYFNKIELVAYSLLPKHFHLLINQKTHGSLEKLIRSLCTRYAIYYNKKYKRSGSLFAGPYKLFQIKDVTQLLHLTRYLHREPFKRNGGYEDSNSYGFSSYKEYLGERVTSWIKAKVVLSYFDKSENKQFKGIKGYKNFVEKHELKEKEERMLERIIIESKPKHLERRILKRKKIKSFKAPQYEPIFEPRVKIPEFIATATILFVMLFTLGVRNIRTSAAQTNNSISPIPSPTPQVSGAEDIKELVEELEEIEEELKEVKSEAPRAGGSSEPEAETMVVITITDESESVNLRKEPTTKSEKVGKAKDGDTFKFVSKGSRWYQIKLDNGEIAFVSVRYAGIEGEGN